MLPIKLLLFNYLFLSSHGFESKQIGHHPKLDKSISNSMNNPQHAELKLNMNLAVLKMVPFSKNNGALRIIAKSAGVISPVIKSTVGADIFAKLLGYVMVLGSMTVYTPIIIGLLKSKSSEGLSTQTWIFNVIGITLAATYPIQKQFALSSYLELVVLSVQSMAIFGIISHYNNDDKTFLLSLIPFCLYFALIKFTKLPNSLLQPLSVISSLICNYANIPQMVLTYQTKKAVWSRTTSLLSLAGNLVRIFTTLQLTKDYFFLFGFSLGALTNGILFLQTFIYPSK